jgi:hypothetical protein
VIFKIINLLLMEKSLIIYGKNPGIVSAITLGVVNLISPFLWEGIFIPLVPDVARELFGAPVPLIIGTISPPRLQDISPATAILHLNDDCVQAKLEFILSEASSIDNSSAKSTAGITAVGDGAGSVIAAPGAEPSLTPSKGIRIPSLPKKRKSSRFTMLNVNTSSNTASTTTTNETKDESKDGISASTPVEDGETTKLTPKPTTVTITVPPKAVADDVSVNVYIKEVDFLAWFTRLPEVNVDMPIHEEISKRINHLRKLLCKFLLPQLHYVYDILLYDPKTVFEEASAATPKGTTTAKDSSSSVSSTAFSPSKKSQNSQDQPPAPSSSSSKKAITKKIIEKSVLIKNTTDHILLSQHLPEIILQQINILLIRIKDYNYHFCGDLLSTTYDWNRFLKKNEKTHIEEFYPNLFLEPIRNKLEFQEAIVHTQMFISFMDRLRKESQMVDRVR